MDPHNINDDEILYRAIREGSGLFVEGQIMPGFFINSRGASVSRDGGREEKDIIDFLTQKIKNKKTGVSPYAGCVKISAKMCRDAETYPNPVKNETDIYHAEIHDSETVVEVTLNKALRLCDLCEIVL